jgi:hypothetical protein
MESQVSNISHNMEILMENLERKFRPFREFGSSNLEDGLDGKYRDKEELKKNPKKYISSSNNTSSAYLFKLEVKVDIKPCLGGIDVESMDAKVGSIFYCS